MNKKNIIYILAIAIVVIGSLAIFGKTNKDTEQNDSDSGKDLKIAATIFPIYDIARNVAGENVEVELVMPPGASPHTFDPTPKTLTNLQGSAIIFSIGLGLDSWIDGIIDNVPGSKKVDLDKNIILLTNKGEEHDHDEQEEHEHDHGEYDPHYWLDPDNAVLIAREIEKELIKLDPKNKKVYEDNTENFVTKLNQEKQILENTLAGIKNKNLITFHDAFGYLADHFDLEVPTTFEPFPGKEPTPSYLQELQTDIDKYRVKAIFSEPQLDTTSLSQFARDNNLTIYTLDPIGGIEEKDSYIKLMQTNINTIAKALK